jgi:hypothetical protein
VKKLNFRLVRNQRALKIQKATVFFLPRFTIQFIFKNIIYLKLKIHVSTALPEQDEKKKKQSWALKQKKGLASRAATSSLGKVFLKKFVDKETQTLMVTVKKLVAKVDGTKKASQINRNIIKIAVKVIILYRDKKVTEANFESLKGNFRRICSTIKNNWRTQQFNEKTCERLLEQVNQFEKGLIKILKPHITSHTEKRIDDTFQYLANPQFLLKASKLPEFEKVVYVLSYYLVQTPSN